MGQKGHERKGDVIPHQAEVESVIAKKAGSGGAPESPKLVSAESILSLEPGFDFNYGEFYLVGPELVIRTFIIHRAASVAIAGDIRLGAFDEPWWAKISPAWGSDPSGISAEMSYSDDDGQHFVPGQWSTSGTAGGNPAYEGALFWASREAVSAVPNQYFNIYDYRVLLADPAAAYEAYEAL